MPDAPDFGPLLGEYRQFRSGYPPAVYARIFAACPPGSLRILDLASGTGLSAEGLTPRASRLVAADLNAAMLRASPVAERALGRAEALPFRSASFDLVTCAQAFHWMDPAPAYAEMDRILVPGGVAAIWWKYEDPADPTARAIETTLTRALGQPAPHTMLARGEPLPRLAESSFGGAEEVWLPHSLPFTVASYVGYQASRENLRRAAGDRKPEVLEAVRQALRALHGDHPFSVAYRTRLLLLRRRTA